MSDARNGADTVWREESAGQRCPSAVAGSARPRAPRLVGVLVVLAVLLVGAIATRLTSPDLAGQAVPVPLPDPPAVGDCVVDNPYQLGIGRPELPTARMGACAAPHYGEIVLVVDDLGQLPRIDLDSSSARDPEVCRSAVDSYLGVDPMLPDNDRGPAARPSFAPWSPVPIGNWALIGPDERQRRAGRHWVACVSFGAAAGVGSVRDSYPGGTLPSSYAACEEIRTGTDLPCSTPHDAEVFGDTGLTYQLADQTALAASCVELVGQLTGLSDVTAGGRLAVTADVVYYDVRGLPHPGFPAVGMQAPMSATCLVRTAGSARLADTLFGLGDDTLPLVG